MKGKRKRRRKGRGEGREKEEGVRRGLRDVEIGERKVNEGKEI